MVSTTVRVARWAALALGIGYGYTHRKTLLYNEQKQEQEDAYHRKQQLIQEAKAAYAAQQASKNPTGVVTDPEDPNFDLEKLLIDMEQKEP